MVERISRRRDFEALAREGRRTRSGPLSVRVLLGGESVAVAYAIPRAVGPAVSRNRLRRRLRAAIETVERAGGLAPGRYLISARHNAVELPFDVLVDHLRRMTARTA